VYKGSWRVRTVFNGIQGGLLPGLWEEKLVWSSKEEKKSRSKEGRLEKAWCSIDDEIA